MKELIERTSRSLAEVLAPRGGALEKVGTGFAVSGGKVATCAHVLGALEGFRVQFWGESKAREVSDVKWDFDHDLAILSVEQPPLPLELGASAQIDPGDDVLWGGFPLEVWVPSFHKGMVSFRGQLRLPFLKGDIEALQLDGTSNRGNSGGPVIDPRDGRVVAIVSASMGKVDDELMALLQRTEVMTIKLGGVDPITGLKKVIMDMNRHLQLGVAYGISVDYLSELVAN